MVPAWLAARLGRLSALAAAATVAAGCAAPGPPAGPAGGGAGVPAPPSVVATPFPANAPAAGSGAAPAAAAAVKCSTERPPTPSGEPDFALFGYPRTAARSSFRPGTVTTIAAGGITLELPADLYTSPLDFELLTGDAAVWQPCVEENHLVIAPYAYRVTDPATGQRVGRFDKPVKVSISDPRLVAPAAYWITSAENPARVQVSSRPPVEGKAIQIENGSARLGWFTTVPKS